MNNYNNGTAFCFIRTSGRFETKLKETLESVTELLSGKVETMPYILDWKKIITFYNHNCDGGDIDEFCSGYVLGYAMLNNFTQKDDFKEAMYLQIKDKLYELREKGEIA
ncbi:MAG: hypothetical protein QM485_15170 [Flavobacteriaceae bacterium]